MVDMVTEKLTESLNDRDQKVRLESLERLMAKVNAGELERPEKKGYVNNHIHTAYSFSPYSPSKAVWMAYKAGLATAGIMDHDSISGAREFIAAGKISNMKTTVGVECRADFSKTLLNGRRINNPDQESIAYVAMHGIPHTKIDAVKDYFKPYSAQRNKRNALMTDRLNKLFSPYGVRLDYEKDVVPLSMQHEGGSITERHILYSLSLKLIETVGKGRVLVEFLKDRLHMAVAPKVEGHLLDVSSGFYAYDLLGALKSDLVESFYIDALEECPDISGFLHFCDSIGAISAYAYLGDVGTSVTGDKKPQKFEDDYIELLFDVIFGLGFHAVTYMPSRNSPEQLMKVKSLCDRYGFMQISGEDINSPRQSFVCPALENREFDNLKDSTWALIGHEKAATADIGKGMFSQDAAARYPDLRQRVEAYKKIGQSPDGESAAG